MNFIHRRCFLLYFITFTPSPTNCKKYVFRPDCKLLPTYVTEEFQVFSKLECVTSCSSEPGCHGVSWSSSLQLCLLSDRGMATSWPIGDLPNYLESDPLWATYGEIIYPVTHLARGTYTLTYSDAIQACIDHNTELATEEQVLAARAMGLGLCACGWFANGITGYRGVWVVNGDYILWQNRSCKCMVRYALIYEMPCSGLEIKHFIAITPLL